MQGGEVFLPVQHATTCSGLTRDKRGFLSNPFHDKESKGHLQGSLGWQGWKRRAQANMNTPPFGLWTNPATTPLLRSAFPFLKGLGRAESGNAAPHTICAGLSKASREPAENLVF